MLHSKYKFEQAIIDNKFEIKDLILNNNLVKINDSNKNLNKLKHQHRSFLIRKIHVHIFGLLTLVLAIIAIILLSQWKSNFNFINDGIIILGVGFGTFLAMILFILIILFTMKRIFKRSLKQYKKLNELINNKILTSDISKYSVGIQMAYSSRYTWKGTNNWNMLYPVVAIAMLMDKMKLD